MAEVLGGALVEEIRDEVANVASERGAPRVEIIVAAEVQ